MTAADNVPAGLLPDAALRNDIDSVRRLLAAGACVDSTAGLASTALMKAAANDADDIAQLLLAHGANPDLKNWRGETALMQAVGRGADRVLLRLLDAGADLDIRGPGGRTALDFAVAAGRPDVADEIRATALRRAAEKAEAERLAAHNRVHERQQALRRRAAQARPRQGGS